jgi:hypothetical protein
VRIHRSDEITPIPEARQLSPDEVKEAYALARAAFTAGDLQKYTELDEGILFDEILADLENSQREFDQGKA